MPLVPLDLPAGFYRNGTDLEGSNRWRDGSLVRWMDGSLRPVGGWSVRKEGFTTNPVRGMHTWQSNNGTAWVAGGSYNEIVVMTGAGVLTDITPDDLSPGRESSAVSTGYGFGYYGTGIYGQPRPVTSDSVPQEASVWMLDNWGQNLVALHSDDGRIFEWALSTAAGSELVATGDFATDTNWTKGVNWSIANNYASYAQLKKTFDANDSTNTNIGTDTITITAHGFSTGDEVTYTVPASPATALGGLTTATNYFIVGATTNTIQLAATSGGAAIDLTRKDLIFDGDDAAVVNVSTDKIVATNTFTTGEYVTYSNGGGVDIGGLTNNAKYYIVGATSSEFQLALTSGGSAIDLTADFNVSFDPNAVTTSATSITVTVVNVGGVNKFHFGGVTAPTLTLIRGTTYTFDLSDASNSGHPLVFTNGGASYSSGVTTTGTAGQAGASVTFAVPSNAPASGLAYVCSVHGATMGNTIATVPTDTPIDYSTETITIIGHGLSNDDEVTYSNGGGTNIGGLTTGTNYFVISATTDTFKLAATSGGSAINLTAPGGSLGTNHSFDLDIGSTHSFTVDHGNNHELARVNFGNLDQTVSGLVATPDAQDSYDLTVTLIDRDDDSNASTLPNASVKVTGTTSTTVLVNQTLVVGSNTIRFGSDDTAVKIEIIPGAYNTPNFDIDNVSLKKKTVIEPIANAPVNNKALVVTEERFIFALGSGGNSRKISWCDKEDNTVWTAASTNEAGDIELATAGQIMCGLRTRAGTLIITDTDSHLAQYIGPPYVYSVNRLATNSGAISRLSAVSVDQGAYWFGQENFYFFDGNSVQTLECDVHDYVFGDFNTAQQSKVWGMANFNNEIWWFYCSEDSTEIDRYVAYDYQEGHWLIGNLSRTSGASRGVFAYPFMTGEYVKTVTLNVTVQNDSGNKFYISTYSGSAPTITLVKGNTYQFSQADASNSSHPIRFSAIPNGTHGGGVEYTEGVSYVGTPGTSGSYTEIVVGANTPTLYFYCSNHSNMGGTVEIASQVSVYNHEVGVNYEGGSVFCETGPMSIGSGEKLAKVKSVIPDEKTAGDVDLRFKTRFYPNGSETTHGPYNPANPTSVRFTGRQVRMRVDADQSTDWRVGIMRLDAVTGGKR